MTISEAIQLTDSLKPNTYSQDEKVKWLSILDGTIKKEIIDIHEIDENFEFNGYDENTPLETELLAKPPYDDIYINWLMAQMDFANGETSKYNSSISQFNTGYQSFSNCYNRNNMPTGNKVVYF